MLTNLHSFTKVVNGNLAVLENGTLKDVFKGTTDELNNALFYTYSLHLQHFDNVITALLPRDTDLKFLRSTRTILSYFTRTSARKQVKAALQGDIDLKYTTLAELDFLQLLENESTEADAKKSIAFQLGQTIALDNGIELFTKATIAETFPDLQPYLYRHPATDLTALAHYLQIFLEKLDKHRQQMTKKTEYKYQIV